MFRGEYFKCMSYVGRSVTGQSHALLLDQTSFYKLPMHTFTLDVDTLLYPTLHELISNTKSQNNIFHTKLCKTRMRTYCT